MNKLGEVAVFILSIMTEIVSTYEIQQLYFDIMESNIEDMVVMGWEKRNGYRYLRLILPQNGKKDELTQQIRSKLPKAPTNS